VSITAEVVERGDGLVREVIQRSGQALDRCFQCKKCSAGCPVAFTGEYRPHALIRQVQYGLTERLLSGRELWACLGCGTCGLRCPNGIAVDRVVDALREMARERGVKSRDRKVPLFHHVFLATVRRGGRLHEVSLIAHWKMVSFDLLRDMAAGVVMFLKGKIGLLPPRTPGVREVRALMARLADGRGKR